MTDYSDQMKQIGRERQTEAQIRSMDTNEIVALILALEDREALLEQRAERAEAERNELITAICGHPDHPLMVITTEQAVEEAERQRRDHGQDIDRAVRLEAELAEARAALAWFCGASIIAAECYPEKHADAILKAKESAQ